MPDPTRRPRLFVGSSTEGLKYAKAIQANLEQLAHITIWDKAFRSGLAHLENLLREVRRHDFAVFVWSPDDRTTIRGTVTDTVRDNLVFEFGLFLSELDRDRVWAIVPQAHDDLRIISDLSGVTLLKYDSTHVTEADSPADLRGAFVVCSEDIKHEIDRLGRRPETPEYTIDGIIEQIKTLIDKTAITKYVGKFPGFFRHNIAQCIGSAKHEILIACDFLTYGSFSAYDDSLHYIATLSRKLAERVDIQIIILDERHRKTIIEEQFASSDEEWNAKRMEPEFLADLMKYAARMQVPITSRTEFVNSIAENDTKDLLRHRGAVAAQLMELGAMMPVFVWIADNREAVFSIPSYDTSAYEYGFHTTDADMVRALRGVWDQYRRAVPGC